MWKILQKNSILRTRTKHKYIYNIDWEIYKSCLKNCKPSKGKSLDFWQFICPDGHKKVEI